MKLRRKDIKDKLKKQMTKTAMGIVFDDYEPAPLGKLLKEIKAIKSNNKDCKKFFYKFSSDGPYYEGEPVSVSLEVWGERMETDKEFNNRVNIEWLMHQKYCQGKCRHM